MKTILFILSGLFFFNIVSAQDPTDALRYSFLTGEGGTARNQALGGAGGSLGGEFTSLFLNPAGLGFFKSGDIVITPSYGFNTNNTRYLGSENTSNEERLSFSATGALFVTNYTGKKIRNLTTGIGINRAASFNNNIFYRGRNTQSSYSEMYLEELSQNGITDAQTVGTQFPFGSSMAFNTYLINPVVNNAGQITGYYTLADPADGLQQTMDKTTTGSITDVAIGVGANLLDKFYFGGTFSLPVLRYKREAFYSEEDMSGDTHNDFGSFDANEFLETKGVGVNLKLGVIYKPQENIQLGASFHSPTFYHLTDLYNMEITTDPEGFEGQPVQSQSSAQLNNGNYLKADYNLVTPLRAILSGTYFFNGERSSDAPMGFVTADLEYVDYRGANFKASDNDEFTKQYFHALNNTIDEIYKPAVNARLGGELKLNTWMIRLGGSFYGNPYENESSNLYKITGGAGYRGNGIYADVSYSYSLRNANDFPYRLADKPNVPARYANNMNVVAVTVGFKLL